MYQNNKRIFILAGVMVLLFTGQAMSQTRVLGLFQLGKSTYGEVKANLPKGVQITSDDEMPTKSYGGPTIMTEGVGYNIGGLKVVQLNFDKKLALANVGMLLDGRRFNDIKKILSFKYRQIHSYPGGWLLFKANRDYVYLYLQQDKNIGIDVEYMTPAVYRRGKLQKRQTVEYNKKYERENKKALELEAAKF